MGSICYKKEASASRVDSIFIHECINQIHINTTYFIHSIISDNPYYLQPNNMLKLYSKLIVNLNGFKLNFKLVECPLKVQQKVSFLLFTF
jgi:hypothetical protein